MATEGESAQVRTEPLGADDIVRLGQQKQVVLDTVRLQKGDRVELDYSLRDLNLIQDVVDAGVFKADQTYELQCLGVAFGQILANETPLEWVMVNDEFGRDPALQYPETTIIVFPLTMISKRVEESREVNVIGLFEGIRDEVEKMSQDPEYRR